MSITISLVQFVQHVQNVCLNYCQGSLKRSLALRLFRLIINCIFIW